MIQLFVVTFDWASPLAHFVHQLKVNMMEPTTLSFKERRLSVSNWYLFDSNLLVMEVWINGGSDMGPLVRVLSLKRHLSVLLTFFRFQFFINDILVCWRAMAIWSAARKSRAIVGATFCTLLLTSLGKSPMLLLCALTLSSMFTNFMGIASWLTCGSLLLRNTLAHKSTINMNNKIELSRNDVYYVALIYTSTAASIASNFLATGLIGYTA